MSSRWETQTGYANAPAWEIPGFGRFGLGMEVQLHPALQDGTVIMYGERYLWIGTEPLNEHDQFLKDIRQQVRDGFAALGYMEWLGIPRVRELTGKQILEALKSGDTTPTDALELANT